MFWSICDCLFVNLRFCRISELLLLLVFLLQQSFLLVCWKSSCLTSPQLQTKLLRSSSFNQLWGKDLCFLLHPSTWRLISNCDTDVISAGRRLKTLLKHFSWSYMSLDDRFGQEAGRLRLAVLLWYWRKNMKTSGWQRRLLHTCHRVLMVLSHLFALEDLVNCWEFFRNERSNILFWVQI